MHCKANRAFTLMEMLVVLVILGLVAAILLPVFMRVRENGRCAACLSNERQLGLAFLQYEQENEGQFPLGSQMHTHWEPPSETPPTGEGWAGQIYPYVKSVGVFHCPDDSTSPAPSAQVVSYGYNLWIVEYTAIQGRPERLPYDTKTVLLFEIAGDSAQIRLPDEGAAQGAGQFSAAGRGSDLESLPGGSGGMHGPIYATGWLGGIDPFRERSGTAYLLPDRNGRHLGGSNFLLADGHVKWLLPEKVLPMSGRSFSDEEFKMYEATFLEQNPHSK